MPRGIVIEVIGDVRSYLRSVETTLSANTKLDASFKQVGASAQLSAKAQIAAALKSQEAMRANVAALGAAAARSPVGSKEQTAALALQAEAQAKLNRSLGVSAAATAHFGNNAKTAERDISKMGRGVLAGSGAVGKMGRSLAFASNAFLAFAIGASAVAKSISSAEELEKAQRSLAVAIGHTGGNLRVLQPRYEAVAKAAAQFGISEAEATTGLARATVLTGNAAAAQRAYQEALVISKATGKDFNVALTATSKAQEGITTSLRRYGILVTPTMKGTEQLALVMKRFGGQAAANTTQLDKLRANATNAAATLGQELLPTFNKIVSGLSAWLSKMTESGRLQKDVNQIVGAATTVFRDLGKAIGFVDRVTGSFKNTIELLIGLKIASVIAGWIGPLTTLAAKWGAVTDAAVLAGGAQTRAAAAGGAGAGAAGATAGRAAVGGLSNANIVAIVAVTAAVILNSSTYKRAQKQTKSDLGPFGFLASNAKDLGKSFIEATKEANTATDNLLGMNQKLKLGLGGPIIKAPGFGGNLFGGARGQAGLFGTAKPMKQFFQNFALTFSEQLAQLQAGLTRSSRDDVAAARGVVARIKRKIDEGVLHGQALRNALSLEANALSTIWSAEDAAAQKRAQRAQAAKDRIQRQIEAAIDPIQLEVALSRATLSGSTPAVIRALKALRAAAQKMLDSGRLSAEQQQTALQQIISLNQQIKDAATSAVQTFTVPARLALNLARDTALGRSTTKDLLSIRKAILRFIATHRHNIAALTDAYNQLADINQQLGSSAQSLLGTFKQASTRALTAGLGLTPEQRAALRARLSQLGPGGTVPGQGVGAAGFVIGPDGRPIQVHGRGPTISARDSQTVNPARFNKLIRVLERLAERPQRIIVDLDGKIISDNTTRHQQRHRNHNSSQRRGPNAGLAGA